MRLIDANELEEELVSHKFKHSPYLHFLDVAIAIERMPTIDAVPVVRCKDCIHGKDETLDILEELKIPKDVKDYFIANPITCYMYCDGGEDGMPDYFPPDHYCGFGERKDNE